MLGRGDDVGSLRTSLSGFRFFRDVCGSCGQLSRPLVSCVGVLYQFFVINQVIIFFLNRLSLRTPVSKDKNKLVIQLARTTILIYSLRLKISDSTLYYVRHIF